MAVDRRPPNGVLAREQLLAAGVTPARIKTQLRYGQLYRMHHAIYAVAHPSLLPFAEPAAALLAVGERGVLSHRTAASLWGLAEPDPETIDVTIVGGYVRARAGIRMHRVPALDPRDIGVKHDLRLTAPARSIIDFAAAASIREMEHALAEGRAQRLITDQKLDAALSRAPANHPGAASIRRLLRTQTGRALTRSQRERLLLSLLDKAQLPPPRVNARIHGIEVDVYWPQYGLVVEFDGYVTHGSRAAFERDRKRDQILVAHGLRVIRITDRQLTGEPIAVAARIAQAIALSGAA
jgi:very-short-patch-repair endonuclease